MADKDAFQTPARAALGEERRRLVRTRRFLQAAMAHPATDWRTRHAFVAACVDQLRIAVLRMITQDLSLAAQLRPVLPSHHVEDHAYLDEMAVRLALRGTELSELVAAAERLDKDGEAGLPAFAAAVAHFFDPPSQKRSRPTHSLPPLLEAYGTPDVWTIARKDADRHGSEHDAFLRLERLAYPGLDAIVAEAEQAAAPRLRPPTD